MLGKEMKNRIFPIVLTFLIVSSLFLTASISSASAGSNQNATNSGNSNSQANSRPETNSSITDNSTIASSKTTDLAPDQFTAAVSTLTLADTLNQVVNSVDWTSPTAVNSWTATWGPILKGIDQTAALEAAINQDITEADYADALYVARIASLNQKYTTAVQAATQTALLQLPMSKSLPGLEGDDSALYGDPGQISYELHQRYPLWGYTFAQGTSAAAKWDLNTAFTDFAALYNKPPLNSAFGEMLWANPASNWARSYSSRYYDECAETMSVFLILAQQGHPEALSYADRVWTGLQNHWTGSFYEYTVRSRVVECAMGEFAEIMAQYAYLKGGPQNVPNYNRVAQDLAYKLLANGWSSPGWSTAGLLKHATTNSQTRLLETMGATMALHQFYPTFTATQRTTFQNMLTGTGTTKAWQGLTQSNVYFNGQFSAVGGQTPSNDATICGAGLLFLNGIVPVTGSLNIPAREENYNDYRTPFQANQFKFDYTTHEITIPVNAGRHIHSHILRRLEHNNRHKRNTNPATPTNPTHRTTKPSRHRRKHPNHPNLDQPTIKRRSPNNQLQHLPRHRTKHRNPPNNNPNSKHLHRHNSHKRHNLLLQNHSHKHRRRIATVKRS
jgi:hypothetical protein